MNDREALTVAELVVELQKLPEDTVATWVEWDSEYDHTYHYGIRGVSPTGELLYGGILRSHDGMVEDDEA